MLVASAGNDATTNVAYPAGHPDVIGVAASNTSDQPDSYTTRGDWVDVAAPGCNQVAAGVAQLRSAPAVPVGAWVRHGRIDAAGLVEQAGTTAPPPSPPRFCPASQVTRGQMATFLVRALDLPAAGRDYFSDDHATPHQAAINALVAAGIANGCAPGRFCPNQPVRATRWRRSSPGRWGSYSATTCRDPSRPPRPPRPGPATACRR